jgi:glutaminase
VSGLVSVVLPVASGQRKRLATFSAGMAFGEMAVIDRAPRSAMIVADTAVSCEELSVADFEALGTTHPRIKIKLLENISLDLCRKLRKANRQLSVVE